MKRDVTAPRYFDQDGNPLDLMEWAKLFEDTESRRIGSTKVKGYWVSTVWLGLPPISNPRLIFETMVFKSKTDGFDDAVDDYTRRYATKEGAIAGHKEVVAEVRKAAKK